MFDLQFKVANFSSQECGRRPAGPQAAENTDRPLGTKISHVVTVAGTKNGPCELGVARQVPKEFLLEEAVDDGTLVKTAGTLMLTCIEARLLADIDPILAFNSCTPHENHLLGYIQPIAVPMIPVKFRESFLEHCSSPHKKHIYDDNFLGLHRSH